MLKKLLLSVTVLFALNSFSQNVDEILSNYEIKNGGKEKFASISTLQYNSLIKMNMMGMPIDIPTSTFIQTGKLFRKEMAGMFGMPSSYTLITDTAGYFYIPSVPSFGDFPGVEGGLKKMEADKFKEEKQKLFAMHEFDALIDCKAKDNTIEYLGNSKVEKTDCFKLKVTASNGLISYYYIDINTYLIAQIELSGKQMIQQLGLGGGAMRELMGSGQIDKQKLTILYIAYATIDGIKFPVKQKLQFGANDIDIENSDVQINAVIDKKWFVNNSQ